MATITDPSTSTIAMSQCPWCADQHPERQRVKSTPGVVAHGAKLLQEWQMDYTEPLPTDQGHRYVFTGVDMATSLEFAQPVAAVNQCHTVMALKHPVAAYGWPY